MDSLEHDHAVTGIMLGTRNEVSINGVTVATVAGKAVRGPLLLSMVNGRYPAGLHDVTLGTTTLQQVGAHIGSIVRITAQVPTGGTRTVPFRVVGTTSFPGDFGLGGLGTGAAFTLAGYLNAACPAGPTQQACLSTYQANQAFAVMATVAPGPKEQAAVSHLVDASQGSGQRPIVPTSLVNLRRGGGIPAHLGIDVGAVRRRDTHAPLVVSVARRRREIGLLKALGFVKTQVGAAVCWQATTVAIVGIIVGIPRRRRRPGVWRAFATNLGAVPVSLVPVGVIAALGVGVLVVSNLLAAGRPGGSEIEDG